MPESFDVVGIGCCAVDYFAVAPHYPESDSKVEMTEFAKQGGGLVGTALVTASRLGARARYIGHVGDDELCQFMISGLQKDGVDTSRVVVKPGGATFFAFCAVDASTGERTIYWTGRGVPSLTASQIRREDIVSAKFLHVDGFDMDAALTACAWAKEAGTTVVVDAEVHHERMAELVDLCDVIIPSQEFACAVTGKRNHQDAARSLYEAQAKLSAGKVVVVTAGIQGCFGVWRRGEFQQPAFKVEVVDTTGCGDVFHGAFIYAMLQGWELADCARFASATAALKCRKLGGRAGIPTRAEVDKFLMSDPSVHAP